MCIVTGGAGDFDFDFSQSSMSESQKKQNSLRQLNSLRSSKDKKLPGLLLFNLFNEFRNKI